MRKFILIFLIFFLVSFSPLKILAAKEGGGELFEKILIEIKEKWKEEALPIYKKMWNWFKENVWAKIQPLLKAEYEKRKPEVKEEFKKKTKEIKKEAPQFLEKIWEKFSSLFRK
jgi:ABC-type dipeptide/oligopeptide/nickel transport system permease component